MMQDREHSYPGQFTSHCSGLLSQWQAKTNSKTGVMRMIGFVARVGRY